MPANRILRDEIGRIARLEARPLTEPARKASFRLRKDFLLLKRRIDELERVVARFKKTGGVTSAALPVELAPVQRYSPRSVRAQRERLGLSAEDFGKLLGVSSQAIYNWEHGSSRPRPALLDGLARLRGMSRREALGRVQALNGNGAKKNR